MKHLNRNLAAAALTVFTAFLFVGCTGDDPQTTAVVDLDAVAKAVGRHDSMNAELEAATQQLNQVLQQAAANIQAEYAAEKKRLGDELTDQGKARLAQLAARAQQVVARNKIVAQNARANVRATLINKFREHVRPLTERVARDRGANVVLIANQNVVWHDSAIDITGAVIDAYKANPPAIAETPTTTNPEESPQTPTEPPDDTP